MGHDRRKRRLRTFAVGGALGLLLGGLVLAAQDLVDGALGANQPLLGRRVRQVVTASEPYRDAVDLARSDPAVRKALGGTPAVVLESCAVEDEAAGTRLRFTLRLSGPDDSGSLEVRAAFVRHEAKPAWRFERRRFTPDRTGGAMELALTPPAR
jgi:hypothetical protein